MLEVAGSELRVRTTGESSGKGLLKSLPFAMQYVGAAHEKSTSKYQLRNTIGSKNNTM